MRLDRREHFPLMRLAGAVALDHQIVGEAVIVGGSERTIRGARERIGGGRKAGRKIRMWDPRVLSMQSQTLCKRDGRGSAKEFSSVHNGSAYRCFAGVTVCCKSQKPYWPPMNADKR